jgi:hypothetical protein
MARYDIPQNCGRVRVMMALGGKYAVWNGKDDKKHQLLITCRDKKQAREIADIINNKKHDGSIEVVG